MQTHQLQTAARYKPLKQPKQEVEIQERTGRCLAAAAPVVKFARNISDAQQAITVSFTTTKPGIQRVQSTR